MSAIPEQYQRHRISVDDYHRMAEMGMFGHEARAELINGEIIRMPPIGKRHMGKADRLARWLVFAAGDDAIVRTQGSIRLSGFTEPEPDLLLLRPRDDFYESELAGIDDVLLLIEVSVSSLRYDLTEQRWGEEKCAERRPGRDSSARMAARRAVKTRTRFVRSGRIICAMGDNTRIANRADQ